MSFLFAELFVVVLWVGWRAMAGNPGSFVAARLDHIAAPLYHAMGRALAKWQFVEAGMFLLVLGIMKTEYKYSSTAFFILKGADVKLQLLNRLCEAHFTDTIIKNGWTPILKQLREAIALRNQLAHFEVNYVADPKYVPEGDPQIILTPHHMDIRSSGGPEIKALNLTELTKIAAQNVALARSLMSFLHAHFSIEELRATHPPQSWLQYLEKYQLNEASVRGHGQR